MLDQYKNKEQFAAALGKSYRKHLVYYIHRMPSQTKYRHFEIKKRSGGLRQISAPHFGLKRVQERLAKLLAKSYGQRGPVHGYLRGRSTQTNAQNHVRQAFVLNIDLRDFFDAMNFGRVRGILMSRPYCANEEVATIIAQLCCFENKLPQGAPTSPILSNMICGAMDAELKRLSREFGCRYSRYSDDITISCNLKKFPQTLATAVGAGRERQVILGSTLIEAIAKNGFAINDKKTRLLSKSDRQEVTGLVVNRFVNVPRTYVRNLWSVLHAWQRYRLEAVSKRFAEVYDFRTRKEADFESVIGGRIQYVGSVRGFEDQIYLKLRREYNKLSSKPIPAHESTWEHSLTNGVWIIEHLFAEAGESELVGSQGTAFFVKGVGFVTCAHCIGPKENYVYNPNISQKQYEIELLAKDDDIDLAVFKIKGDFAVDGAIVASDDSEFVELRDRITLVGWPKYGPGKSLSVKEGAVQSIRNRSGIRRFNISTSIIEGSSGGPIFNIRRQVIGVAVTGASNVLDAEKVEDHGAIPIAALKHLVLS